MSDSSTDGGRPSRKPLSIGATLALLALAVLYVQLGPWVGKQLGITLPGLEPAVETASKQGETEGPPRGADSPNTGSSTRERTPPSRADASPAGSSSTSSSSTNASKTGAPKTGSEPAGSGPAGSGPAGSQRGSASGTTRNPVPVDDAGDLPLGTLKSYGRVQISAAGLRYTPSGREGNRLEHVLRHTKDDPGRPVHGVFDGGQQDVVAVIDEAYLKAKRGGRGVRQEREDDRIVYTIDLGRRIGYVGGQRGRRERNPPATKLKLVLEDEDVITAYPVE